MNIKEFEEKLEGLIGRPSKHRPFVCNGSPLSCSIFIVGFNATSEIDFWANWNEQGFNRDQWESDYKEYRRKKGFKRVLSNTRSMINWILNDPRMASLQVLETNVYSIPSRKASDLSEEEKNTKVFRFLVEAIKPAVILIHGSDTAIAAEAVLSDLPSISVLSVTTKHFRSWSKSRAGSLVTEILLAKSSL